MTNISRIIAALFCVAALFFSKLNAQTSASSGTDVPRILSYQGQVTTNEGIAMNGTHHITATLYSDRFGKTSVWQGTYDATITNGNFNILLGSGKSPLPEVSAMNRPLWVGIKVDGGDEMQPLTQLAAAPYAINIPDNSITTAKLAPDVESAIFGHTPTIQAAQWSQDGDLIGADAWIGSKDDYAVEVHVYDNDAGSKGSKRVMRWEPNATSANLTGGYQGNNIPSAQTGSTICGGGSSGNINQIISNFSVIDGGKGNLIDSNSNNSVIIGGLTNTVHKNTTAGFIGAGASCSVSTGANYSAILGGGTNVINGNCTYGFIGGGGNNTISTGGTTGAGVNCTITGGDHLTAQSYAQTVMGHYNSAKGSSVAGGTINGSDPLLIIGNGIDVSHKSNAFEVTDSGQSRVYRNNGTGSNTPADIGGTYKDNIIYAWGVVEDGIIDSGTCDFGVLSITHTTGSGSYLIKLNLLNPNDGSQGNLRTGAVFLTSRDPGHSCGFQLRSSDLSTSGGATQFTVFTSIASVQPAVFPATGYVLSCTATDLNFMFMVIGRP